MSLDPLNVGRLKTCGENLVIAFPWVFFLSTMNVTSFSVCKLALEASFQQLDIEQSLHFTFLRRKITLVSTEKHEPSLRIPLRSVLFFFDEEESAE